MTPPCPVSPPSASARSERAVASPPNVPPTTLRSTKFCCGQGNLSNEDAQKKAKEWSYNQWTQPMKDQIKRGPSGRCHLPLSLEHLLTGEAAGFLVRSGHPGAQQVCFGRGLREAPSAIASLHAAVLPHPTPPEWSQHQAMGHHLRQRRIPGREFHLPAFLDPRWRRHGLCYDKGGATIFLMT